MHMGYYTALNVHQRMQQLVRGTEPKYFTLQKTAPVIALALGDNAVAWGDEVTYGKDIAERFFSNDVGFMSEFLSCNEIKDIANKQSAGTSWAWARRQPPRYRVMNVDIQNE